MEWPPKNRVLAELIVRQSQQGQQTVVLDHHRAALGMFHQHSRLFVVRFAELQLDDRVVAPGQAHGRRRFAFAGSSGDLHDAGELHPLDQLADEHLIGGGVNRQFHSPSAVAALGQLDRAALAPKPQSIKLEIFRHEPQVAPVISVAWHPVGQVAAGQNHIPRAGQAHVSLPSKHRRRADLKRLLRAASAPAHERLGLVEAERFFVAGLGPLGFDNPLADSEFGKSLGQERDALGVRRVIGIGDSPLAVYFFCGNRRVAASDGERVDRPGG